jgi:cyanophycinase
MPKFNDAEGALVIVGGGGTPPLVHDEFFRLAGDEAARVLHIPSATRTFDEVENKFEYYCEFYSRKIASFDFLHTYDRAEAERPEFAAPLDSATGVWIGGGTQSRLTDLFLGTPVVDGLHRLLARGGVIGGTSSGCAVMSEEMILFGYEEPEFGPGFGFFPNTICDPHHTERERQKRVSRASLLQPHLMAVGVDEKAALCVQGTRMWMIGEKPTSAAWFHFPDPVNNTVTRYHLCVGEEIELLLPVRHAPHVDVRDALAELHEPVTITADELVPEPSE